MAVTVSEKPSSSMEGVPTGEGLNFEKVWAMFQETDRKMRETDRKMQETDRRIQEYVEQQARQQAEQQARQHKKPDRMFKETKQMLDEYARKMKESGDRLDKQLGKLGNRFGEMVEYMVAPNLLTRFRELGFEFDRILQQYSIEDRVNNIFTEIDIILESDDMRMLVEVKSKITTEDVNEHIRRMKKVREHADIHNNKRAFWGAVAGMVIKENVKQYAFKNGFYVIEPSGETFVITTPEGDYAPREW